MKYKNKYFNLKYSFETAQMNIKQAEFDLEKSQKKTNELYIAVTSKLNVLERSPSNPNLISDHKKAVNDYNKALAESIRLQNQVNDYKKALGFKTNNNLPSNNSNSAYENSRSKYIREILIFLENDIPKIKKHLSNLQKCYSNSRLNPNIKEQIEKQYQYYTTDLKEKEIIYDNFKNTIVGDNLNNLKLILENLKNIGLEFNAHKNILSSYCSLN
jgi:hypothetical protein